MRAMGSFLDVVAAVFVVRTFGTTRGVD